MATEELRVSSLVHASPNRIYAAWMDERRHTAFTGRRATVDPWVGGRLTAADGYIDATHVMLDTGRRIVMTWRTADFPLDAPDSRVEVVLEPVAGGTKVNIHQTDIPEGQAEQYKKTWRTVYLDPMKRFFSSKGAAKRAIREAGKKGVLPTPSEVRRGRRPILGPRPGHGPDSPIPEETLVSKIEDAAESVAKTAKKVVEKIEQAAAKAVESIKPKPAKKKSTKAKPAKKKPAKKKPAKKKPAKKKAKPTKKGAKKSTKKAGARKK